MYHGSEVIVASTGLEFDYSRTMKSVTILKEGAVMTRPKQPSLGWPGFFNCVAFDKGSITTTLGRFGYWLIDACRVAPRQANMRPFVAQITLDGEPMK
jgi:hypothetical protein